MYILEQKQGKCCIPLLTPFFYTCVSLPIATDKALFSSKKCLYLPYFSTKNMLWRGASNEYPQHIVSLRNKKNIVCEYPFLSVATSMYASSGRSRQGRQRDVNEMPLNPCLPSSATECHIHVVVLRILRFLYIAIEQSTGHMSK